MHHSTLKGCVWKLVRFINERRDGIVILFKT